MIGAVKAAMVAANDNDRTAARRAARRGDQAQANQSEEQPAAIGQAHQASLQRITADKEQAMAQGIGAAVALAASVVGGVAGLGSLASGLVNGAGQAAGGASSAIGTALAEDNLRAEEELREAAGYGRADASRFQGQADQARNDAQDAQARARDRFRAAIEMVNSLHRAGRVDGGGS